MRCDFNCECCKYDDCMATPLEILKHESFVKTRIGYATQEEYRKAYYQKNRDMFTSKSKEYYKLHRDEIIAKRRLKKEEERKKGIMHTISKEKRKQYQKTYEEKHKEDYKTIKEEKRKIYYQEHREEILKQQRERRKKNHG